MKDPLPEKIIKEIEDHNLVPKPRWQFLLKRTTLWSFAGFATILGGVAVSIIIFVFVDHDFVAHTYLNQSVFEDVLLTIPYVWFLALVILVVIAQYSFRHIKFVYHHATLLIVGLVLAGNILIGLVLNTIDAGEHIDNFLDRTVPYYSQLVYTSKDVWSHPEKGLLGGTVINAIKKQEFEMMDFHKVIWRIDINALQNDDIFLINPGVKIKIIGVKENNSLFKAQHIFLWD